MHIFDFQNNRSLFEFYTCHHFQLYSAGRNIRMIHQNSNISPSYHMVRFHIHQYPHSFHFFDFFHVTRFDVLSFIFLTKFCDITVAFFALTIKSTISVLTVLWSGTSILTETLIKINASFTVTLKSVYAGALESLCFSDRINRFLTLCLFQNLLSTMFS